MTIPTKLYPATPTLPAEPVVTFKKPVLIDPNSDLVKSLFPKLSDILKAVPRPGGPEPKPIASAPAMNNMELLARTMIR
ncbi:MAG: hypothetical protein HYR60_01305 [Acidobacteria bacterium]|nr:hypothetical protein [Acidobacteriota bacterium]